MKKGLFLTLCWSLIAVESYGFDVDLKTLPPGKSFTIRFQAMIDDPLPDTVQQISAQGIVSVSAASDILTDDPDTPALLDPTLTDVFQPPVAICRNVTRVASDSLIASVTFSAFSDGSFDPDGPPVTLVVSPPGPFALGTTDVTLTVLDGEGDFSTCTAIITVIDPRTSFYPQDLIDLLQSILDGSSPSADIISRSRTWYAPVKTNEIPPSELGQLE